MSLNLNAFELCGRICKPLYRFRPPLWSSGQGSPTTDPEIWVRFPALPDSLRSSGSGTGSTQPREYNWEVTWKKNSGSGLENREFGRRDPSLRSRNTLYPQKLALTSPTNSVNSVGMVYSRTQATVVCSLYRFMFYDQECHSFPGGSLRVSDWNARPFRCSLGKKNFWRRCQ
jgi:hypothetical protein